MGIGAHVKLCKGCIIFMVELIVVCAFMAVSNITAAKGQADMSTGILIIVDQTGKGDFERIQDSIDSVPSDNSEHVFIWIKPGTYREKIVVPADKPFITLSGTQSSDTIITWNGGGDIFESPTLSVLASDFVGNNITIQNTYGTNSKVKAVALRVSGDKAAFHSCKILSYQDTLLDDVGRHYFNNCYIEGAIDFICGNAASLYEECHLHSLSENDGAITAQHRASSAENTGFTFVGCNITGVGATFLGRPWGAFSRVVFAYCHMSSVIIPQGWIDWSDQTTHNSVYYGEYECYGPGANRSKRVEWSRGLTSEEAAQFLTKDMIGGENWLRARPSHFKRGSVLVSFNGDEN